MRIIYENGRVDIVPLGAQIHGLQRAGKRPIDILIPAEELAGALRDGYDYDKLRRYVVGSLLPAIDKRPKT